MLSKIKVTKKEIKGRFNKILSVTAFSMQSLLKCHEPFAYSAGMYGWDCDYYMVNDLLICTGYRPITSKGISIDYDLLQKYEGKARDVLFESDVKYRDTIEALLGQCITELEGVK